MLLGAVFSVICCSPRRSMSGITAGLIFFSILDSSLRSVSQDVREKDQRYDSCITAQQIESCLSHNPSLSILWELWENTSVRIDFIHALAYSRGLTGFLEPYEWNAIRNPWTSDMHYQSTDLTLRALTQRERWHERKERSDLKCKVNSIDSWGTSRQ